MRKVHLLFIFLLYAGTGSVNAQLWRNAYDSASLSWQKNEWHSVIDQLSKAEKIARNDLGIYDPNYLTILNDLGLAYMNAGKYEVAKKYLAESRELRLEILDPDDPELVTSELNLAQVLSFSDQEQAKKKLLRLQRSYPEKLPEIALQLGNIYDHAGDYDSAQYWYTLPVLDPALPMAGRLGTLQVSMLRKQGNYPEALYLTDSLLNSHSALNDPVIRAGIFREKGLTAFETGEYQLAEQCLVQSVELSEVNDLHGEISTRNALAALYARMGLTDKALNYLKHAIGKSDPNSPAYAQLQQNLASLYAQAGEYNAALKIYEQSVNSKAGNPEDRLAGLINFSGVLENIGRTREADSVLLLARQFDHLSDRSPHLQSDLYAHSGLSALRHADFDRASKDLRQALEIQTTLAGEENPSLYALRNNLGLVYVCQGKIEEALPLIRSGVEAEQKYIRYTFPILSRREKIQFYSKLKNDFNRFNSLVLTYAPNNQELINTLFSKQLLLKGIMIRAVESWNDARFTDPGAKELYSELQKHRQALSSLYNLSFQSHDVSARLKDLEAQINAIEDKLTGKISGYDRSDPVSWQKISENLEADQVLVDILRISEFKTQIDSTRTFRMGFTNDFDYVALILESGKAPRLLPIDRNGREMENKFFNFYSNSLRFNVEDGESYARFWQPVDEVIGNKRTVYVINDGVYHKLNLNSLYNPETQKYLLEKYDIHLLINPADVLSGETEQVTGHTAYLCGDPLPTTITTPRETFNLEALPYSGREINAIAETLRNNQWEVAKSLNKEATIDDFLAHTDRSVIHVATHGFFSADLVPVKSELPDAGLLASGLVFTPDSTASSTVLTGYEILGMDFSHTDLIVLSACETGLGEIRNGEGIDGLQRAFLGSGAKNLILSLWQVDDKATQELMVRFYSAYLKGSDIRSAFRQSQLDMLSEGYTPRYWSAFILAGS